MQNHEGEESNEDQKGLRHRRCTRRSAAAKRGERRDGWVIQPTPNPGGQSGEGSFSTLEAVSCTSATNCTATGNFFSGGFPASTLAEHWDGTSWQVQPTPNPADVSGIAELRGVKCISGTFCVATGEYQDSTGVTKTLAERWDGSTWSITATPNPAGAATSQLNAVACTTVANCIAAGTTRTALARTCRWPSGGMAPPGR